MHFLGSPTDVLIRHLFRSFAIFFHSLLFTPVFTLLLCSHYSCVHTTPPSFLWYISSFSTVFSFSMFSLSFSPSLGMCPSQSASDQLPFHIFLFFQTFLVIPSSPLYCQLLHTTCSNSFCLPYMPRTFPLRCFFNVHSHVVFSAMLPLLVSSSHSPPCFSPAFTDAPPSTQNCQLP